MSLTNLGAILAYTIVIFACISAAQAGRERARSARHVGCWLAGAGLFASLALLRLLEMEERARGAIRQYIRANGRYEDRALLQVPFVILTLIVMMLVCTLTFRASREPKTVDERLVMTAILAMSAFMPLYALRIISWHVTDRILYGGSVPLNWVVDLGLSTIVAGSAVLYARLRPPGRPPLGPGRARQTIRARSEGP